MHIKGGIMYRMAIIILVPVCFFGQHSSSALNTRIGLKIGSNHCVLNRGEGFMNQTGNGYHAGIGFRFDAWEFFVIDVTSQAKSYRYNAPIRPGTEYRFTSLYVPATISFKALSTPGFSIYIGAGGAINMFLHGETIWYSYYERTEVIPHVENDYYLCAVTGIEWKLKRLTISPEFSLGYNITNNYEEFDDCTLYDLNFTLGFHGVL
jgi:hypothetical protein